MNNTKLEELEKAYKKEKDHKVRTRMVVVRMVRVCNMSVKETADIQGRSPNWKKTVLMLISSMLYNHCLKIIF